MFSNQLRQALSWLSRVSKDRKLLALLAILAVAAYLRLWNIEHLFNVVHDYDEGAWSLAARFISEGYLPYQDFILVHPPFYELVLASVYKVFGYSFFSGRYLAVALSLACIILIYLVGKKMYHPTAGIFVAALFAVSPEMVYFGRRSVQETLGIFLILLAIYFAIDFINNNKQKRLLLCGLALGLAVATKYIFVPAAIAIILTVILLTMGENRWQSIKNLGRPAIWVAYISLAAIFYSLLMLLKWSLKLDVSIPFLDPMYWSVDDVAVAILVFLLPLVIAIAMLERSLPFRRWWLGLWALRHNRGLWLLLAGTALGFIGTTGFFWVKMPQEFISQTVLLQQNQPLNEFPSLVGMIRVALFNPTFLRMAFLPILLVIPLIFVLLNKQSFSKSDCFLSVALIVSLVLCQGLRHLPRYYASVLPFFFLGISQLVPPLDAKMLTAKLGALTTRFKVGLLVVLAILFLFLSLSVVLLTNYTGYDVNWPVFASNEEQVYKETLDYLEGAGAEKVYATSPSFTAMSPNLDSSLAFDTFALLWLAEKPPKEMVEDMMDEGVDYVVLDSWTKYWGNPYKKQITELVKEVQRNARLVMVIAPDSPCSAEIYLLGAEREGIFNGDFAHWVKGEEIEVPLGWESVIITGEGDEAEISQAYIDGRRCLGLTLYEDGMREENRDSAHTVIVQRDVLFATGKIRVQLFPQVNTVKSGSIVFGPSIHFTDRDGHVLIIGFSDEVDEEVVLPSEDGDGMLVIRNTQLHQWSELTIDLPVYWSRASWVPPQEIDIWLVVSSSYNNPGYSALYIAGIELDNT